MGRFRDFAERFDRLVDFKNHIGQGAASRDAAGTGLPGHDGGLQDVFRHILGAAEITRRVGALSARAILNSNEFIRKLDSDNGQYTASEFMDFHNNDIGIKIGQYAKSYEEARLIVAHYIVNARLIKNDNGDVISTSSNVDVTKLSGVDLNTPIFIVGSDEDVSNISVDDLIGSFSEPAYFSKKDTEKLIVYVDAGASLRDVTNIAVEFFNLQPKLPRKLKNIVDDIQKDSLSGEASDDVILGGDGVLIVEKPNATVEGGHLSDITDVDLLGRTLINGIPKEARI